VIDLSIEASAGDMCAKRHAFNETVQAQLVVRVEGVVLAGCFGGSVGPELVAKFRVCYRAALRAEDYSSGALCLYILLTFM
jgi:hypothetical protein